MMTLLKLAERCEHVTAKEHRAVLSAAYKAVFGGPECIPVDRWPGYYSPIWDVFHAMLDAGAFESAAMRLVDPRALWAYGSMEDGPFARLCWPMPDGGFGGGYHEATAATVPLAIVAAALKARAASCDTHPKDGNSTEIEVPLVSGAVTNEVRQTPDHSSETPVE